MLLIRTCAHSKKVRGKSPRRYNSCVRQPMRHVMALRVSKAVLVFAIALFYTILVLNNITDYGSNYEFVRHVLMMDSTFPGNHGMWRAVNSPLVHTVFYIGKNGMGRKRHSECLPLSVWCFWLWCNASQLPISRVPGQVGFSTSSRPVTKPD